MIPLRPKITTTTTQRDYADDNPPTSDSVTETEYRLDENDRIWIGLSSITFTRGNRYDDGEEYILRVGDYSSDPMKQAVLALVHEMKRQANDNSSEFHQNRAISFLADLRSALD